MNNKFYSVYDELTDSATHKLVAEAAYKGIE
jgi:hypothetical protein